MPKQTVVDTRFDFRGGRNTAISPDLLNPNELVDATNARLNAIYGGFTKRSGCQRIHQTAFSTPITGVTQWDGPSGKQVVVIAAGHLWYRNGYDYSTAFTDEGTNVFSTSTFSFFATFRAVSAGAPLVLFIASGGKLFKWTGTTLTDITGVNSAPSADRIIAYHTRLFARQSNLVKNIFWGRVGDGEQWGTGTKTDGGSAVVDIYSGESFTALETIGSSLLMAGEDCVMRFTGHATDDIVISQDTEGISSEVGAVGAKALHRFENIAAMLSERGPYIVDETHVEPIGEQVGPDFFELISAQLPFSVVDWNRGRKELWFAVCRSTDSGANKTAYIWAPRLQAWYGPWTYSFGINYLCRYEDSANDESLLSGGSDGYVRDMDVGSLDDILYDGSGGSNISMRVELPVIQFGLPGITKALDRMALQADIPANSNSTIAVYADTEAPTSYPLASTNGEESQRIDFSDQGKRFSFVFTDSSSVLPFFAGFVLEASNYNRR